MELADIFQVVHYWAETVRSGIIFTIISINKSRKKRDFDCEKGRKCKNKTVDNRLSTFTFHTSTLQDIAHQ
jgi:hypothetical protein